MSTAVRFGRYRAIAELGRGGMADVFLSVIEGPAGSGFAKLAVVKKLRPHLVEDAEFVSMLIDEARITARLNHPNVVQMLEVGDEGGEYFLAMEYLDGQPLHRILRRAAKNEVALSRDVQLTILSDVLAGLHHAHDLADYDGTPLNVVHRDATPQNIFVTYDGQVKVVDFGIAKAAGRISETRHGIVKGKVRYMSPEQALGVVIDRRSDIFAVGIMLWQALTGQQFWADRDELSIVQALVSGDYDPSPRAVCPDIPEALDAICCRALARRAEDRFEDAAEMRAAIEAQVDVRMIAARRELSRFVCGMFVVERSKLRSVLEGIGTFAPSSTAFLAAVSLRTQSTTMSTVLPPPSSFSMPLHTSPPAAPSGNLAVSTSIAPVVGGSSDGIVTTGRSRRDRYAWAAAGFALALVVASIGLVGRASNSGALASARGEVDGKPQGAIAIKAAAAATGPRQTDEAAGTLAAARPTAITAQTATPPAHHWRWYPPPPHAPAPRVVPSGDPSANAALPMLPLSSAPRAHRALLPLDTADPWARTQVAEQ